MGYVPLNSFKSTKTVAVSFFIIIVEGLEANEIMVDDDDGFIDYCLRLYVFGFCYCCYYCCCYFYCCYSCYHYCLVLDFINEHHSLM